MKCIHVFGAFTLAAVLFGCAAKAEEINCYELEFTSGTAVHKALLLLKGVSGVMRVRYFSESRNRQEIVQMKMTVKNSARGLLIESGEAIDTTTGEKHPTYAADNFLIRTEPDGTKRIINIDDAGKVIETTSRLISDPEEVLKLLKTYNWKE